MMTGVGVLLGTAAYMSPEQAKGREADKRSDIWAFGCVLYEMLTGRRAFDGEDMTEVLGAVVRLEPNWEALPSEVPQPVRTLLQTVSRQGSPQAVADIAAALFVLDHQAGRRGHRARHRQRRCHAHRSWRRATPLAAAVAIGALLAGGGVWLLTRPAPPSVIRTTITTSGSSALRLSASGRDIAITPDGSRVVYRGDNQLLVRALNQLEPTVLSVGDNLLGVFISSEGQWVGFFDGITMRKVAITGGPPVTIARLDSIPRGRHLDAGRHDYFRDEQHGDGPPAHIGRGRDAGHPDAP